MQILRARDRIARPWKNGGGVTREVAVWPPGADLDTFEWRVSIAEVRAAGPFSAFEGIDRTLAILEGRMTIAFADRTVELDASSAPFDFSGDASCCGTPIGGAVTDLNVMARRGRATARVERVTGGMMSMAPGQALIVASAATAIRMGQGSQSLERFDAMLIDGPGGFSMDGAAFVIRIN